MQPFIVADWISGSGFRPHAHQARAFARLSGSEPRSTLIATGTGSGKTEAFLYPVLEHCRAMRAAGRRGVKAIFIYPMNALTTDQAGRVAREIVRRDALSHITAGLFVGDDTEEKSTAVRHVAGDRYTVITDSDRMREEPPNILLTNYKMLDFLLMRARDANLWRQRAGYAAVPGRGRAARVLRRAGNGPRVPRSASRGPAAHATRHARVRRDIRHVR